MMIKITVEENGKKKTYNFDEDKVEKEMLDPAMEKLTQSLEDNPMLKQTAKSSIGLLLGFMGIQKPKELQEMDNLTFTMHLVKKSILSELSKHEINLKAEGENDEQEDQD